MAVIHLRRIVVGAASPAPGAELQLDGSPPASLKSRPTPAGDQSARFAPGFPLQIPAAKTINNDNESQQAGGQSRASLCGGDRDGVASSQPPISTPSCSEPSAAALRLSPPASRLNYVTSSAAAAIVAPTSSTTSFNTSTEVQPSAARFTFEQRARQQQQQRQRHQVDRHVTRPSWKSSTSRLSAPLSPANYRSRQQSSGAAVGEPANANRRPTSCGARRPSSATPVGHQQPLARRRTAAASTLPGGAAHSNSPPTAITRHRATRLLSARLSTPSVIPPTSLARTAVPPPKSATDRLTRGAQTAATSNSRLRQGALIARRQSRQLIASEAARSALLPEARLASAAVLGREQQTPSRRIVAAIGGRLSRSSIQVHRRANTATAPPVGFPKATPSQQSGPPERPIRAPGAREQQQRQQQQQLSSSGGRSLSGKTRAKVSLTSSTSSLSLAVVKRPRASECSAEASPEPVGAAPGGGEMLATTRQAEPHRRPLRAAENAPAARCVAMEEETKRRARGAVVVVVGTTDPISQTIQQPNLAEPEAPTLSQPTDAGAALVETNSGPQTLVANDNNESFATSRQRRQETEATDKENVVASANHLFVDCCGTEIEQRPREQPEDHCENRRQHQDGLQTRDSQLDIGVIPSEVRGDDANLLAGPIETTINNNIINNINNSASSTSSPTDEMMINQEQPQQRDSSSETQQICHILIHPDPHKMGHVMIKSDGPGRGQPFGLHQSINIETAVEPAPLLFGQPPPQQQRQSEQQMSIVDQCLSDLVENVKGSQPIDARLEPVLQQQSQSPPQPALIIDIPIKTGSISDLYDLESRPFARGKFAQVKRCVNKSSRLCFAAKCIKKRRRLVDIRHEILLEIEALKLSYHTEHIVKLFEVYETSNEMILVLEMANGGELQRVLDDEEFIDEKIVRRMVRQILDGLIHLHDNDIAHLDIKPQNILLTEPFPNGNVKLCDFGISRRITKDCEIREICGTPDYVAPEILRYDPIGLATDMWSLGVLTYVLLSGYSPFGSENKQQTFCNITQAALDFPDEIFAKISGEAVDFVRQLIVREPPGRLTSRLARQDPWIAAEWR